ncbi:hypothetical protein [Mucilaginibacter pedocola]|uniref:DUF4197 domain-containing protein n=1 Tax=Mucilaginibacter pedocola TaxID=1792845 RepID=A0A1S9PC58_9SPHI|nr:hypothetical protein [Mucilaginibacter pedocola]OOQ58574.1 hypothetical protein BC343_07865 [Mucilaginibacter pedocola]
MKKLILTAAFAFAVCLGANAQSTPEPAAITENPAEVKSDGKSLDQLKEERAALIAMVKSEDYQKRLAKVDGLKAPKESGVASVDALSTLVTTMLGQLKDNRNMVPQLYASVTGQTLDGVAATGIQPISPDQMVAFSKLCLAMGSNLVKSSKDLVTLPGDISSAGFMKGLKALKSVAYIKSAIGILKDEISYNSKMVSNLMETNKLASLTATTTK